MNTNTNQADQDHEDFIIDFQMKDEDPEEFFGVQMRKGNRKKPSMRKFKEQQN